MVLWYGGLGSVWTCTPTNADSLIKCFRCQGCFEIIQSAHARLDVQGCSEPYTIPFSKYQPDFVT